MKMRILICSAVLAAIAQADDLNVVLFNPLTGFSLPSNSVATPAQVFDLSEQSGTAYDRATNAAAKAAAQAAAVSLYSSNYVVTSTVYVQSIGGVPYDPSNQTVTVRSVVASPTNVVIVATVRQTPLSTPKLDWRAQLNAGAWSNLTAAVAPMEIPPGAEDAAAAYRFTIARPDGDGAAFFRVVDNSSGASGSGLWWLVYGGIYVDGKKGLTGSVTNIVGSATNVYPFVGGILVESEPLGE